MSQLSGSFPADDTFSADDLRDLAQRLGMLVGRLEAPVLSSTSSVGVQRWETEANAPRFARIAKVELQNRRIRGRFFPGSLFAEPAWDILLDLYANYLEGRRVTVKGACLAADVPGTTALRYICDLEQRGLIKRSESVSDRRVRFVELSQQGQVAMDGWLRSRETLS